MMLYTFIKKDENVIRVGGEASVPAELQAVFMPYSEGGYVPATAEEYDQQVIGGAAKHSHGHHHNHKADETKPEAPREA